MKLIYENLCPNDGEYISSDRLSKGLVCEKCLPEDKVKFLEDKSFTKLIKEEIKILKEENKLKGKLKEFYERDLKSKEFNNFFKKIIGKKPFKAQTNWFMKAIRGESFALTVPTGLGKTTFGIIFILYSVKFNKNKKFMFITPTRVLVDQIFEKFENYSKILELNVNIVKSTEKNKKNLKEKLKNKDFNVAIITPMFLGKNKDIFRSKDYLGFFDVVFVDDVDALLKRSKRIDDVLYLIGFNEEIQVEAKSILKRKREKIEEFFTKIGRVREKIEEYKNSNKIGQLIFASATTRIHTSRIKLLKYLLGFEPGSSLEIFREKIYDIKKEITKEGIIEDLIKLIKDFDKNEEFKGGGIIYVPIGKEKILNEIYEKLKAKNIKIEKINKKAYKVLNEFKKGNIDILIGPAYFYGTLVRGIDFPERIRYVIFAGVPCFKFSFKALEEHPLRIQWLGGLLLNILEKEEERRNLLKELNTLRINLEKYTTEEINTYISLNKKGINVPQRFKNILKISKNLFNLIKNFLKRKKVLKEFEKKAHLSLKKIKGEKFILIPDSLTYIQGSGRTSRMFFGGVTTGLSILLIDDKELFEGLNYQLQRQFEEFKWKDFKELKIDNLIQQINKERIAISKRNFSIISKGKLVKSLKTALFVVESPTKARTIASFFGRPSIRYVNGLPVHECLTNKYVLNIIPTFGHLYDLINKDDENQKIIFGIKKEETKEGKIDYVPIYTTIKKCRNCRRDLKRDFSEYEEKGKCNYCGSTNISDSIQIIEALQELAKETDLVIIATDPDSEGEKIAYDVYLSVKPFTKKIKRAEMHEITFKALNKALKNLRDIKENLVNAQIIRRIGDRIVGFSLSSFLQKTFGEKYLSAGRVQSPVLKWIIERYDEVKDKDQGRYAIIEAEFENTKLILTTEKIEAKNTRKIKNRLRKKLIRIEKIEIKDDRLKVPKPLTTTEMLTYGVNRLKVNSDSIMKLAQDLFEAGLITYHRTDSYFISDFGFKIANQYFNEINKIDLFERKQYDKPGAHECIRPTKPLDRIMLENSIVSGQIKIPRELTSKHYRLYELIFSYFVASQSKPAKVKKYVIEFKPIKIRIKNEKIEVKIKKIEEIVEADKENSFLFFIPIKMREDLEILRKNSKLKITKVEIRKIRKKLFTEDEVIRKMKEERIGRPSTYSSIIKKLREHRYVFLSIKKKALIPTDIAMKVKDALSKKFSIVTDVKLTRKFEEFTDKIEQGECDENEIIKIKNKLFNEYYEKVHNIKL